ncbi:serine/arginine repetitive matrix protein 2-like [Cephus cinctus]|uniref:Serine/arginine repetitive matrix protein 2-like n=1 Tax=Cephus cinctus TaxID=211228 RepID=A0AAJ7R7Q5_CEPCN|nr:serine/arginine repetitive matrix protein 2-like [Cephus cinctus]
MNGFRTLFLQDLACALTSKPFQYGSACQLHTGSSCRRFWNFFDFPKMEESLSRIEKSSKDLRIPCASAPREPVATSTGSSVAGNVRRLPSTGFGFDGNTPVYRATCNFHKPFAKRKVEETSLLDGNPVPRNLKLKLQGYKMLESEFEGFGMAGLGEERSTEDVFEIRGDSKMRENSIQSRSAAKEAEREERARETARKDESVNLAQDPRLSGESKNGTVPLHSQAPRPPSIPPPPCCPPPLPAPSPPADPQCPSREPRCPSKTPAEGWSPPNSHPEKPTCPPPCPRTCTTTPWEGAGQDCEGPWSVSGPSSLGTASQSPPSLAVSFPKEPLRSVDAACPLSPAAPTSCSGGTRIPSASVAMPSLRLKESRTSLNSIASGRSVSGLSSIGSVGVLTNSSGQSALPRTARSLPGLPRESKKASAAFTAKSQSSCSARNDCPKSKSKSKSKRKEPSCKKKVDRCKRKGCFDDEKDSLCTNKGECPERKRPRKKKSRKTRKTCSARVSKPPARERKSKCKERARGSSSCGSTAPAVCPRGSTDETCSTKKPQCPARKRSKGRKDAGTRKGPSCTRERDRCKRTRERSCGSSKSSARSSRSPCSPRRAPCSKEKRKSSVCKSYVCPGNVGPETCSTNKPQCPRRKKKSASKRRRSCSRRSDKSCAPGRRGSCGSRSFCSHVPGRLSPILGRFYGRDVSAGKDDVKCGEDIFARKYPKPGPKCKKSRREGERDVSCQRATRTSSCEGGRGKKSQVNSTRAKKDDVQSVKDQLAKEREEVKKCKEGGSRKRTTSEARKQSCASEKAKAIRVREDAGSKDGAGKPETGVDRVISPCKLKKAGPCKDTKSSKSKAKEKKKGGEGKRCSASASDVKCIVQCAPKQLLETTMSHVELLRKYSGGSCRIESSKDTSLRIPGSHERPVLEDDR